MKKKITGIGGIFFKSENDKVLKDWYKKHLGIPVEKYGATFRWKKDDNEEATTSWNIFSARNKYLDPSTAPFMINYRVEDLEYLLGELEKEGIQQVGKMETFEYGKFAWIMDPDGNKIELWEPVDGLF